MADAIALDGFLYEETMPGDVHESTARFRVIVSPTDERTDEMILPCSVADPALAHTVIHDLVPGDKLRVTGCLRLPRTPGEPMQFVVNALTVLQTALQLTDGAYESVLERCGTYLHYIDGDTGQVQVWTEHGSWVGWAEQPDELAALVAAFEHGQAPGGE
ncbi:hypothetical protein [Streptomyces candidus]|uniref:Uncharacterized protein n=1 Tax=Streptomyces candidus TaxID=67283 RepID=A0A7X0HK21_9ACTN|nr:hypothetical protein [Streptomyces candidus]MBB6439104.1 hypothetical protein [Streptomyces candidus]GHH55656.1 hypothetical protein GCM10018773_60450 [Streptomyces candidus]